MLLNNKVAIITGAASGIGLATTKLFLAEGGRVIAGDISASPEILDIAETNANCVFIIADVTQADDHQKMIDQAVLHFGQLDICFNNAGILGDTSTPAAEQDMALSDKVFAVNVRGVQLAMNAQIQYFLANDITLPSIINTASVAGKVATPNAAPYVASKHAVVGLTKAYAIDYASRGVRINMVAPGVIETPMADGASDEMIEATRLRHPIGRIGKAGEIAELVLFLASEKSTFINGSYFNVDGGYLSM